MKNDDQQVWKAFIDGDDNAYAHLYDRYVRILYSYGLKMQPDPAIVEDAIQDLFVDVWRLRSRLIETDSVRFYLYRAMRRRLHRASHAEELYTNNLPDDFGSYIGTQASSEQLLITNEINQQQTEQLNVWISNLPQRQQEALSLRYYQNFSYSEIAELLSINEQSARNLIQKALGKLRQLALSISVLFVWMLKFFC